MVSAPVSVCSTNPTHRELLLPFKVDGNASKSRIVLQIFYALFILKALTEEYTYNLAHMVQTNIKTSSHLKGVQVGKSPRRGFDI